MAGSQLTEEETNIPSFEAAIRIDNLPANGRNLKVKTNNAEREALARYLKVQSVDKMIAQLNVVPIKRGVQLTGSLSAVIVQACVVTFEPVAQEIDEELNRVFLLGQEDNKVETAGVEVFVDLDGDDLPDYFEGPEVNFSALLLEVLGLAIDPFPRQDGAKLETSGDPREDSSPFAVLKGLKSTGD